MRRFANWRRKKKLKSRRSDGRSGWTGFEVLEDRRLLFKPYTHVEIARDVLVDVVEDGRLSIGGNEDAYPVHPKIVAALTDHEEFYFAGTVGPDAFPDLPMG